MVIGIIQWAVEKYVPELRQKLNLTENQVHFLERIADYVNRGKHILEGHDNSTYCNFGRNVEQEKYVELIVRSTEFKAAGLDKDLTDSFDELDQFHLQINSPVFCQYIQTTNVTSMLFAEELENNYTCLDIKMSGQNIEMGTVAR